MHKKNYCRGLLRLVSLQNLKISIFHIFYQYTVRDMNGQRSSTETEREVLWLFRIEISTSIDIIDIVTTQIVYFVSQPLFSKHNLCPQCLTKPFHETCRIIIIDIYVHCIYCHKTCFIKSRKQKTQYEWLSISPLSYKEKGLHLLRKSSLPELNFSETSANKSFQPIAKYANLWSTFSFQTKFLTLH